MDMDAPAHVRLACLGLIRFSRATPAEAVLQAKRLADFVLDSEDHATVFTCLKHAALPGMTPGEIIDRARIFLAFVESEA